MALVESIEVAVLIRDVIAGARPLRLADHDLRWLKGGFGDIPFLVDAWRIVIFQDSGGLDYVDEVIAPDGRRSDFDDWATDGAQNNPIDLLSSKEQRQFEKLLFLTSP